MKTLLLLLAAAWLLTCPLLAQTNVPRTLLIILGAPGEAEYGKQFAAWADLWEQAAAHDGWKVVAVGGGPAGASDDRTCLLGVLTSETTGQGDLWLVFLGHGTFDGHTAKFNLRGPDLSAADLAAALQPCTRPLAILQCASASGPFLNALSAPGRVIITATRSGREANATRFGGFLARAVADSSADLDKDGQVSLLEAFLMASRQVQQSYREQGRILTEHALLDDNGDGLGAPAEWFHGVRPVKAAAAGKQVDGVRAHQFHLVRSEAEQELSPALRARRDELEAQLNSLRGRKTSLGETEYYDALEKVLTELATLRAGG